MSGVTPELIAEKTTEVISKLDENLDLYLDAAKDPPKIAKASLKDINLSLGISIDKRQLLSNKPTSITQTSRSDEERLLASIRQVIEQCAIQGVTVDLIEAANLLKSQLPEDSLLLDRIIEGDIIETSEVKGLIAA